MRKILTFLMLFISIFSLCSCDKNKTEVPLKVEIKDSMNEYIDSLMKNTLVYIPSWNKESFKGKWNYIDGVFLNSIVNLYKDTGNEKYKNFFLKFINYYIDENGNFINPATLKPSFTAGELDSICESKILFDAYEMTNDNRYLLAIENTYSYLTQISNAVGSPNYSHKEVYLNQIWLDGMYMYVPFYLRYANYTNNDEIYDIVKNQYEYIRDNMYSEEKKLYYHGHDTTKSIFWADRNTGNSKSFWLRSMGWYIVSLADSIEYMKNDNNKAYLISLLNEAIDGILLYQDNNSKMFYQLIDKGNESFLVTANYFESLKNSKYYEKGQYISAFVSNYLESSGSSMLAYAILKSARLGYINEELYQRGIEIFEGIYNHSVSKDNGIHLNDICITAGLGPDNRLYRDGSPAYYLAEPVGSDDGKGVGPFIMAYLEYIKK